MLAEGPPADMASSADKKRGYPPQLAIRSAEFEARRATEEIWQEKKDDIKEMYIRQNLSLPVVKQRMEVEHGVTAT